MNALGPYYVGDKPRDSVAVGITRGGAAVDLSGYTSVSIELESPAGFAVDVTGVAVSKTDDAVVVTWPSAVSLFTAPGMYTMQVLLHTATAVEHATVVPIVVFPVADSPAASWASLSDVLTLTKTTVDAATLMQAQGVVELHAGVSHAMTLGKLRGADKRALRQAVAYQAAFLDGSEGVFTRAGVDSLSQDGLSVTSARNGIGQTDTDTFTLAPLARAALRQLTWTRASDGTTTLVRTARRVWDPDALVPVSAWKPIGEL